MLGSEDAEVRLFCGGSSNYFAIGGSFKPIPQGMASKSAYPKVATNWGGGGPVLKMLIAFWGWSALKPQRGQFGGCHII